MIIEKESEVKVLRNFCFSPFEYFSIAQISKKINISRNWIYKIISKFKELKILQASEKKYKLDFTNPFCKKLKLLFDVEFLLFLDREVNIFDIANKIIFEVNPESLILTGSMASGKQRKGSDIDFLAIGEKKELPLLENCNIVMMEKREFKEKYLKGDDFLISSLLFGKIILDKEFFIRFFESPLPIFSQEVIQEKIKYCHKIKERIYSLLNIDREKAQEELLYIFLQTARIILLKQKKIPLTKYDLAEQVEPFDKRVAKIISGLLKEKKDLNTEEILDLVEECMNVLG